IVLAAQTGRSVQAVHIVLRGVQERVATLGVTTAEDYKRLLRTPEIHDFLRSRVERLPQVDSIALIDAEGARVNNSLAWPPAAGDLSDRHYARHFSTQDDPGLFISEPVVSRSTGAWTLYLSRRVSGAHGEYIGLVLGSV